MVFTRPAPKDQHPLMFLAEAEGATRLVKLVQGGYGAGVQQTLAKEGLAPILYGSATVEGAPTAYVMEHLSPHELGQSKGWVTLFTFMQGWSPQEDHKVKIDERLRKVVALMEMSGLVHGDLRPNNIMLELKEDGSPVELDDGGVHLKVVDFDWAGPVNLAKYPKCRNKGVIWPGVDGEAIEAGHDGQMLKSWWIGSKLP